MTHTARQKKTAFGKPEPIFVGLSRDVAKILDALENVSEVLTGHVAACRGGNRVKLPNRWALPCFSIVVCDSDRGERELIVYTKKPGAILRILRNKLEIQGISIHA
jgi:hypothetical protein